MVFIRISSVLALVLVPLPSVLYADRQDADFQGKVKPLLTKYCVDCHQGDDARGQVDLEQLTAENAAEHYEIWESVAERLRTREMPPEDELQPSEQQRLEFLEWYDQTLVRSVESRPAALRPRRLCAVEYRNTMRSLFGFDLEVAIVEAEQTVVEKSLVMKLLPPDPPGKSGFCNDTQFAPLTTSLWDQYSYLADAAIEELFSSKRRDVLERIVGPVSDKGLTLAQAEELLKQFAQRAHRRPVGQATMDELLKLEAGTDRLTATKFALKRILMSPHFLYRSLGTETQLAADGQVGQFAVDDYEFAQRLSYFIWADMPDEELFEAARQGNLSSPEQIRQQIDRMIASPKSVSLSTDFAHQWLTLGEVEKNNVQVPQAEALRSQPRDFMRYLFLEDRPLIELIDSRVAFANPYTQGFYGDDRKQMTRYRKAAGIEREIVPNQKIKLEKTVERGGILTMPGILAMNEGPILRGVWILERILGEHLPEPPPDVGQVPPAPKGVKMTFRQRFEQHRANSACAVCHNKIDPLGFALQRYEGAKFLKNGDVDTTGKLPSGETFNDFQELKTILVTSKRRQVIENIVERTLSYAVCRKLELFDRPTVEAITDKLDQNDGTYRDLVYEIAISVPMRKAMVQASISAEKETP